MPSPYDATPMHPAPDPDEWAAYEAKSRAAADFYPERVRRAALPGCAGGCGRPVMTLGRVCIECRAVG